MAYFYLSCQPGCVHLSFNQKGDSIDLVKGNIATPTKRYNSIFSHGDIKKGVISAIHKTKNVAYILAYKWLHF